MSGTPKSRPPGGPKPAARAPDRPLDERERSELQALLDTLPAPLEPLDASVLDGFLCGVLVQPRPVPVDRWLPHVTDADGRPLPRGFDAVRLHTLVRRRHAELDDAIARRAWFDPWVYESEAAAGPPAQAEAQATDPGDVYPWVAGFATAMELFPALMACDAPALITPLALLYRHLGPDDLEDADDLLAEIESMEPAADLVEAVEGLVRATLLLADVGRPVEKVALARPQRPRPKRPPR